ncbi:uncharacterized protein KY384_008434 [Bacidia gigantensis]|uniref:uncharacterized protein n=1 Tax=Bacidia gigantensis TaxID=2732470 RepID=UPI001D03F32D|nr:uncharacterized protein KY384_008434 [Bacidia gigantensis]KAG8527005.1 hypothetical protein KY384_008434 [Bacidia gigantensis]
MNRLYVCSRCLRSLKRKTRHFATQASPDLYDVAVIGGGPAGLSLLTALRTSKATSNLRLALIESRDLKQARQWRLPPDQYSNRASSLTPASRRFLEKCGTWSQIDHSRLRSYQKMQVWDGLSDSGRISFNSTTTEEAVAYMVENSNLTKALASQLELLKPISMFDNTMVENIQLGPPPDPSLSALNLSSYPHVALSSKHTIAARLLVGADGVNGPVRTFAGIPTRGWDYDRHGVVATLKLSPHKPGSDHATAYQRFLPSGPIALLPLPNGHATLVWTTTLEQAARLKSLSSGDFLAMVNAAFRLSVIDIDFMFTQTSGQLDEFQWRASVHPISDIETSGSIPQPVVSIQPGSIASFPLRLRQAATYTSDRIALIGDAAHTIHPLAGQGLNMGLSDSQALAGVIGNAIEHGADIGNELQCLDRFNNEVWMKNNRMLGIVDKLHWLYNARNPFIVGARSLGLRAVDSLNPLKGFFMRQASGS